jgi:cob(I)alamin adenosyltransferase
MAIDERIEAITRNVKLLTREVQELKADCAVDVENIRTLARIAERRLTDLED